MRRYMIFLILGAVVGTACAVLVSILVSPYLAQLPHLWCHGITLLMGGAGSLGGMWCASLLWRQPRRRHP